jgi:hypothetical protein
MKLCLPELDYLLPVMLYFLTAEILKPILNLESAKVVTGICTADNHCD